MPSSLEIVVMLVIRCPACQQAMQIAEDMRGKPVRCPGCKRPFQVSAPPPVLAVPPPAAPIATASPAPAPPQPVTAPKAPPRSQTRSAPPPLRAVAADGRFAELGPPVEEFLPRPWWLYFAASA